MPVTVSSDCCESCGRRCKPGELFPMWDWLWCLPCIEEAEVTGPSSEELTEMFDPSLR